MNAENSEPDYHSVDIIHVEALQARSIGVETLAWHAVLQLQLDQKLTALGFSKVELAAAIGTIIDRVVSPGSELHTHDWLQSSSALGELLDHDYEKTSLTRLYTISDQLLKHQTALETFLSAHALFDLNRSIVLYDLIITLQSCGLFCVGLGLSHLSTRMSDSLNGRSIFPALNNPRLRIQQCV